jgi:Tol biopolymer transport system component
MLLVVAAVGTGLPAAALSAASANGVIAFTGAFGGQCDGQLCTVHANGQDLKMLPAPPGTQEPAYARDGKRIAFAIVGAGTASLATMNADGTGLRRILTGWQEVNHPTWSPDGDSIAFAGEQSSGGKLVLCVVRADGSGLRILGDPTDVPFASEPSWSPNGRQIAFVSFDGTTPTGAPNPSGIYVVNADGSDWHRLTPVSDSPEQDPAWSPDGSWIAYSKLSPDWKTNHVASIFRMQSNGTGARQLTSGGFWDGGPVISPDGKQIAFYRYRGATPSPHMYEISATGSAASRVLTIEAAPHAWIKG